MGFHWMYRDYYSCRHYEMQWAMEHFIMLNSFGNCSLCLDQVSAASVFMFKYDLGLKMWWSTFGNHTRNLLHLFQSLAFANKNCNRRYSTMLIVAFLQLKLLCLSSFLCSPNDLFFLSCWLTFKGKPTKTMRKRNYP